MNDLFFLFTLYFNKDYCLTNYVNKDDANEDIAEYKNILSEMSPISEELLPFFYLKDNNKTFMSVYYYMPYINKMLSEYNLKFVQDKLANFENITENMIKFYFPDITETLFEECKASLVAIDSLIRTSGYNVEVKSGLYSFFINPTYTIQKLTYELIEKNFWLLQKYEKFYYSLNEKLINNFNLEDTIKKINSSLNKDFDCSTYTHVSISFCLFANSVIKWMFNDSDILFIFGKNIMNIWIA